MALPIAGVPYYKLRAKIIPLVFFFLFLEITPDEFPVIGNYGENLLAELKDRPVAINSCRLEELLRLPGVDEGLAQVILKEREKRGRFNHLTDLLSIKEMNFELWERIIPFLIIEESPKRMKSGFKSRTAFSSEGTYHFTKFNLREKELSFSFLTEKDKGEEFFDWTAFHLTGNHRNLYWLLGDFLPIGPELIFSPPYFHHYRSVFPKERSQKGLKPIDFVAETHYLRGLGIEFYFLPRVSSAVMENRIQNNLFLSSKGLDATIDTNGLVQRIHYSGEHRDSLSRVRKGQLKEKSLGWQTRWLWEDFSFRSLGLASHYSEKLSFGQGLLLIGFSTEGKMLRQKWGVEWAKSLPGGWGWVGWINPTWRYGSLWLRLSNQKGNYFNLYGDYPNIHPGDDKLRFDTKLVLAFPFSRFSLSYNTKVNFTYDSLPHNLWLEWEKREKKLEIKIYQKIYIGEEKRRSGFKITYNFPPNFTANLGVEDKYQKDKRGFKFTGMVKFSYRENRITLSGYKTILSPGIDFYHLKTEGYKENSYLSDNITNVLLGYEGMIGLLRLNLGLGVAKKEKSTYDFKLEIRR